MKYIVLLNNILFLLSVASIRADNSNYVNVYSVGVGWIWLYLHWGLLNSIFPKNNVNNQNNSSKVIFDYFFST